MIDLVKKLKSQIGDDVCEIYSHEALFSEAAAEITRLRAALADAQAVGFAAGVEAAKSFLLDAREISDDDEEVSPSGETFLTLIASLPTAIRALTPPDATAAAARVLLDVWPTDASFDAAFNACAASYHGGDQMQDVMDRTRATVFAALRAIAGDTP